MYYQNKQLICALLSCNDDALNALVKSTDDLQSMGIVNEILATNKRIDQAAKDLQKSLKFEPVFFGLDFTDNRKVPQCKEFYFPIGDYTFNVVLEGGHYRVLLRYRTLDRFSSDITYAEMSEALTDVYEDILRYCEAGA